MHTQSHVYYRCKESKEELFCKYQVPRSLRIQNINIYDNIPQIALVIFLFDVSKMPTAKHGIVSGNVNDEEYLNGFYADHG